jgi:methylated-DNA-[protein]-cysteine S-methyltransferase
MTTKIDYRVVATPLGRVAVAARPSSGTGRAARGGVVCAAAFADDPAALRVVLEPRLGPVTLAEGPGADAAAAALARYFAGDARALDAVPVDAGGTPFQRAVWDALREIPAGEVRSYGALAARLGRAGAARAVGGACARNPVAVLVPCHRAVASTGALTGFAFGLDRKRWLLAHEAGEAGAPRTPVSARTARARP